MWKCHHRCEWEASCKVLCQLIVLILAYIYHFHHFSALNTQVIPELNGSKFPSDDGARWKVRGITKLLQFILRGTWIHVKLEPQMSSCLRWSPSHPDSSSRDHHPCSSCGVVSVTERPTLPSLHPHHSVLTAAIFMQRTPEATLGHLQKTHH